MSSSPAPSADRNNNVFSPNAPNVKVVNGAGQAPSSSSSSSNTWKEESQPTWTPEAQAQAPAPSSSSPSWTPEAAPSSSSSVSQWTPPHAQVKVVATPSSSSQEPAQTPATSNVGRAYGAMGLAWDWQNPKGVLHNWCGKNAKIYSELSNERASGASEAWLGSVSKRVQRASMRATALVPHAAQASKHTAQSSLSAAQKYRGAQLMHPSQLSLVRLPTL